jgi:hypothetical protein
MRCRFENAFVKGSGERARAAMLRYIEISSRGYAPVEVCNNSMVKLTTDDLVQLMAAETQEMVNTDRA